MMMLLIGLPWINNYYYIVGNKIWSCEPGKVVTDDEKRNGHLITATNNEPWKSSMIWFKMTSKSLKNMSQTILEYQKNVSTSLLNNSDTVKSVYNGYHAEALQNLMFKSIAHPPYYLDLMLCDFYFLPLLKGNHDGMMAAVASWIWEKSEEFLSDMIKKLVMH